MKVSLTELVVLGIFAGLGNVLGGLILFPSEIYKYFKSFLSYLLALSAGFMMAVVFVEILPRIISSQYDQDQKNFAIPMILILSGYLLTHFFEHTIAPHFHLREEITGDSLISPAMAYTAISGLTVHTFFDGISIAAALMLNYKAGLMVFIAVLLHKVPEGFTIASMVLAAGKTYRHVLTATSLIGLTTFLGVLLFSLFREELGLSTMFVLPIACGITLYVAASDLIPEVNHHGGRRPILSLSVFVGVALFFVFHFLLHSMLAD